MSATRRLAVILAADAAGHSRPIEADEKGSPPGRVRFHRLGFFLFCLARYLKS